MFLTTAATLALTDGVAVAKVLSLARNQPRLHLAAASRTSCLTIRVIGIVEKKTSVTGEIEDVRWTGFERAQRAIGTGQAQ
jgi:hypothetical protein